jgi:hypothetical protein
MGEASYIKQLLQLAVTSDMPLDSVGLLITLLPTSGETLEHCLANIMKDAIEKIR